MELKKTFSQDELNQFSFISGDYNLIHKSELKDQSVVHGILLILYCLDQINRKTNFIKSIKVNFHSFLYVNQLAQIKYKYMKNNITDIFIYFENQLLCSIKVKSSTAINKDSNFAISDHLPNKSKSKIFDLKKILKKNILKLYFPKKYINELFPNKLTKYFSISNIASLIALSNIIGMKCPGYYSIFSSFNIVFKNDIKISNKLIWYLDHHDTRWNRYLIGVYNDNLDASLVAFERPKRIIQPLFLDIKKNIKKLNLKNKNILVIGGSSGIGEVCVKLLSYHGANVTFTYLNNLTNAKKIKKECTYKNVNFLKFDILNFNDSFFIKLIKKHNFSHYYYFATPKIFNPDSNNLNINLFNKFSNYYISTPIKLINLIKDNSPFKIKFFYPSSTAVDANMNNLKEYALVKQFGEISLNSLNYNNISIIIYKFPRLLTDQTSSIHKFLKSYDILIETNKVIMKMVK